MQSTMELRDALSQIGEIRLQLARAQLFRGFRALPTAISGLLALAAAFAQASWIAAPVVTPFAYAGLWVGSAALSMAIAGGAMALDCARARSGLTVGRTREALARLAPSFTAGALATAALLRAAPEQAWLLPGLWQIFFSLALFSCRSLLPRGTGFVAAAYLVTGSACLTLGPLALSPWTMGLAFGLGQLWTAAVLHLGQERAHAAAE